MRNLVRNLFSLSFESPATEVDVTTALIHLKNRLTWWWRLPFIVGWLILALFALIVSADLLFRGVDLLSNPGILMLITGFVAAGLALLAFHLLIKRIPSTLEILWQNHYVGPRTSNHEGPLREENNRTWEIGYARFIQDFERSLNDWRQWPMGLFFALLVVTWTVVPVLFPIVAIPAAETFDLAIFTAVIELLFGLLIGLMAWRMLIVGLQVARIGNQHDFELIPRIAYPDRGGGLEPLGNLILLHGLPISAAGIHLGSWIIVGALASGSGFGSLAVDWSPFYAWLLLVPIAFAAFSLAVPLWSIHQVLIIKRDEVLRDLAEDVESMSRSLLEQGHQMGPIRYGQLVRNLEQKQKHYLQQYKAFPIWPVNLGTSIKFALSQVLPVLGGIVGLLKSVF